MDLRGAWLVDADLSRARFIDVQWEGAIASSRTRLPDAPPPGLIVLGPGARIADADLSGRSISGLSLRRADLSRVNLRGATLWKVDLSGADLSEATLEGLRWRSPIFIDAHTRFPPGFQPPPELITLEPGVRLDGLDLSGVDLSEQDLRGASLIDAELSGTVLRGADLRGADLRGSGLAQPPPIPYCLRALAADIAAGRVPPSSVRPLNGPSCAAESIAHESRRQRGTLLHNTDFRGADLREARLEGARVGDTDLRGAALDGLRGSRLWCDGPVLLDDRQCDEQGCRDAQGRPQPRPYSCAE